VYVETNADASEEQQTLIKNDLANLLLQACALNLIIAVLSEL
jgi:hypothetical protein